MEPLKVKYKIGEIEFEAIGAPEDVEHQRLEFIETLLPTAIDAMVRTCGKLPKKQYQYIEEQEIKPLPEDNGNFIRDNSVSDQEWNISVNEFMNQKHFSSKIDIAIGLIFYYEKAKKINDFSTNELKQYFRDAKIPVPGNVSDVVGKLVTKSFIMKSEGKGRYQLTKTGEKYVDTYEATFPKDNKAKSRPKKARAKIESVYSSLSTDSLNLDKYPEIKSQNSFKNRMMLTIYIVFKEGHGEAFSTQDVQYLMTEILGLPATKGQVQGVFDRNKSWFTDVEDQNNKKSIKHRLLTKAKDYAISIINNSN